MHTEIFHSLPDAAPGLRLRAEQRARRALRRFAARLIRVRIHFRDENGPRGGVDTSCRLVLETHRGERFLARGLHRTPDGALGQALRRARRGLSRRVAKARLRRRAARAAPAGEDDRAREKG